MLNHCTVQGRCIQVLILIRLCGKSTSEHWEEISVTLTNSKFVLFMRKAGGYILEILVYLFLYPVLQRMVYIKIKSAVQPCLPLSYNYLVRPNQYILFVFLPLKCICQLHYCRKYYPLSSNYHNHFSFIKHKKSYCNKNYK